MTFILSLTRTVRGHRYVSRSQKTDAHGSLQSSCTWRANLNKCLVQPRWGTSMRKSSQTRCRLANDAGIQQAEKKQKTAHRIVCPLTTGGLISVRRMTGSSRLALLVPQRYLGRVFAYFTTIHMSLSRVWCGYTSRVLKGRRRSCFLGQIPVVLWFYPISRMACSQYHCMAPLSGGDSARSSS